MVVIKPGEVPMINRPALRGWRWEGVGSFLFRGATQ
jgi:hypothetical protein